jgi:hypothetical protein
MAVQIYNLADLKLIEFVCTANHGRSPVAELIAQAHLKKLGLDKKYRATSSGSSVDAIAANKTPDAVKMRFVKMAKERGDVYAPAALASYDDAIADPSSLAFDWLYQAAVKKFQDEEHGWRDEAVEAFGIEGVLKEHGEQTVVQHDASAVLSMAPSNNKQVRAIYEAKGYTEDGQFHMQRPEHSLVVAVLPAYARNDLAAQNPDAFGVSRELYFQNVEAFQQDIPKAVEKILNETAN